MICPRCFSKEVFWLGEDTSKCKLCGFTDKDLGFDTCECGKHKKQLTAANQRIKELEGVLEDHISKMIFWKQSTQNPDKFVIGNWINDLKQSLPKETP